MIDLHGLTRLRHTLTRTFVETPERVPAWAYRLLPKRQRDLLRGLKRIDASRFGRVVMEDVEGRRLQTPHGERFDFATGSYLGLEGDLTDEDVEQTRRWGLRNGWSRASGITPVSGGMERALATSLGFDEARLAPCISLINLLVFHALERLFPFVIVDADAHLTLKRGVRAAYPPHRVFSFRGADLSTLEAVLRKLPADLPKLVVTDGIYSMRGVEADVRGMLDRCHDHGGTLVIDDAHGFGILGERGLGVVEKLDARDRRSTILIGGFSKAAANPLGFIAFSKELWWGVDAADFLSFCGPPSNLHTLVAHRHLDAFDTEPMRARRNRVRDASRRLHAHCERLGIETASTPGLPILSVRFADHAMEAIVTQLDAAGIFAKVAIYPVARHGEESVRFCLTATHTEEALACLEAALTRVARLCHPRGAR